MGSISLKGVSKVFGEAKVIPNDRPRDRGRRVRRLRRSVRLRQVDPAAADRRAGGRHRRPDPHRRRATPPSCRRHRRGLSMVFQSYALYPHMSVHGNMGFPLKMAGLEKAAIDKKVRGRRRHPQPDRLSRPQAPASFPAASASAWRSAAPSCASPTAFLFDEPLSNLDAALRVNMRLEISELHQQLKTTMIYVTHDQVEAMTMADKIVVLNARQHRAGRLADRALPQSATTSSSPASSARRR